MVRHGDLVATVDLCLQLLHHTSHSRKETLLLLTFVLQHGDYIFAFQQNFVHCVLKLILEILLTKSDIDSCI